MRQSLRFENGFRVKKSGEKKTEEENDVLYSHWLETGAIETNITLILDAFLFELFLSFRE